MPQGNTVPRPTDPGIIPLTVILKVLPLTAAGPLPDAVGALAVTHLAGLLAVALTAADHRRLP